MLKNIRNNHILTFGRDMDPGELEQRVLHSGPDARTELIRQYNRELERDDLTFNERASLLGEKSRIGALHERMLRVYR